MLKSGVKMTNCWHSKTSSAGLIMKNNGNKILGLEGMQVGDEEYRSKYEKILASSSI